MKFFKKTFPNGLRLITVPMKESPTATVLVLVEAGSKYEAKNINGISHFLEHVCFKGTKNRPRSIDLLHELDALGSQNNAFTAQEFTGYYAKAHPRHTNQLIDIISDIYLNSTFPKTEIEREKGVIIEEMNMYEDLPQRKVSDVFMKLLYGDQPAGRTILGSREVIRKISRKDFITYRRKHYVAKGTIVVVAGDINSKKVETLIKKKFVGISNGKKYPKPKVIEKQKGPQLAIQKKKTDQTHIVLGFRAYKSTDKRISALHVLSTILGQGMSSRIFQKLREELGAAYYVRSYVDDFTDHGIFEITAGVDKTRLPLIISEIIKELRKFKDEIVGQAELEKAKEYLIGNMVMGLESSDQIAEFYGLQEISKKKIDLPSEAEKKIRKITSKDIQNVARDLFSNDKINLAIVGDVKNHAKIKSLLKI